MKIIKKVIKTINSKYFQAGVIHSNCLMDHILYQIFKKIIKNHDVLTDNPPTRVCVNKVGNRIRFKI